MDGLGFAGGVDIYNGTNIVAIARNVATVIGTLTKPFAARFDRQVRLTRSFIPAVGAEMNDRPGTAMSITVGLTLAFGRLVSALSLPATIVLHVLSLRN